MVGGGFLSMRASIKRRMCVTPVTIYKQSAPNSMAETQDLDVLDFNGYVYNATKVVINKQGREEVSDMQIYMDGEDIVQIEANDLVSCMNKTRTEPLKVEYYFLPEGVPGVGVIYLK